MSKFKKIMIILLSILIIIPIFVFGYTYVKLNSIYEGTDYVSK